MCGCRVPEGRRTVLRYAQIERSIGHTLSPSGIPLAEMTGIPVPPPASRLATPPLA